MKLACKVALAISIPMLQIGCRIIGDGDLPPAGEMPAEGGERSTSLSRDLRLMWSVMPTEHEQSWVPATEEAINASERVFNTLDLRGLSMDEIKETLRFDLRADNYGYYAPFWPIDRGVFPIRIDNGNYGWQYDIHFDSDDRVEKVLARWIH